MSPHADVDAFCKAFTHSIISWNKIEIEARKILLHLASPSTAAFAAIAHLGNVPLRDALLAATEAIDDDGLAEQIRHGCELMDRLRAYRNHYVHGLIGIGHSWLGGEFTARTWSAEAKGRITWSETDVTPEEVRWLWQQCSDCQCFLSDIARYLEASGPHGGPAPSFDKPPLPERLKRSKNSLVAPQDLPTP